MKLSKAKWFVQGHRVRNPRGRTVMEALLTWAPSPALASLRAVGRWLFQHPLRVLPGMWRPYFSSAFCFSIACDLFKGILSTAWGVQIRRKCHQWTAAHLITRRYPDTFSMWCRVSLYCLAWWSESFYGNQFFRHYPALETLKWMGYDHLSYDPITSGERSEWARQSSGHFSGPLGPSAVLVSAFPARPPKYSIHTPLFWGTS